ncbi:hypothetical protein G195_011555, partial [Phytophthora kernoviae 00238/432]
LKQQSEQFVRVSEERDGLNQQNHKLQEEVMGLREGTEQSILQKKEFTKLNAQLQTAKTREAQMVVTLKAAEKESENNQRRKEEVKILYAKFSSSMDDVAEKTVRIEELEQEREDAKSRTHDLKAEKKDLELQIAQLQQDQSDLLESEYHEKENMSKELAKVQKKYAELAQLDAQQKELVGKMKSEIAQLKAQNQALTGQQPDQEHQSVGQASTENVKRGVDDNSALAYQVAEKEALLLFIQRYYSAAEEKCSQLLRKVSELETQKTSAQQQTRESCDMLRMCTQIESCNDSVRASLVDVMATLESLP